MSLSDLLCGLCKVTRQASGQRAILCEISRPPKFWLAPRTCICTRPRCCFRVEIFAQRLPLCRQAKPRTGIRKPALRSVTISKQ